MRLIKSAVAWVLVFAVLYVSGLLVPVLSYAGAGAVTFAALYVMGRVPREGWTLEAEFSVQVMAWPVTWVRLAYELVSWVVGRG